MCSVEGGFYFHWKGGDTFLGTVEEYTRTRKKVQEWASWAVQLPLRLQIVYLSVFFAGLDDRRRQVLLEKLIHITYPDRIWADVDAYMERMFLNDLTRKPKQVAYICMRYKGISYKMAGHIVKRAQRIKKRVLRRLR